MLVAYLALTTLLGAWLAGKQQSIRDFFLGGRRLPWYAVSGSIIATEISAVTFISAPAIVFKPGGDFTYLQLAIGAVLARIIIGIWFVPAFYSRDIYSPYDYIGHRLGIPVKHVTSGLFVLGAILGQSVRLLLTALILELLTGLSLTTSIWIIGAVAVLWTLLGGITTVIWTDVVQFFVFLFGLVAALVAVVFSLDGGWSELIATADAAGKLRTWDLSVDPGQAFTLWAAILGNTILCLNAYGTDQLIAQRMFCCKTKNAARLAIISSSLGLFAALLALFVGAGLFAYYETHALPAGAAELVADKPDRILPIFILDVLPPGVVGLIIAGVFAAAISSLDSALAALSQTVVTSFGRGALHETEDPRAATRRVLLARGLVVVWGVVLCVMAQVMIAAYERYDDLLNLALAMASYTAGALLAAFFLALFRANCDYRGMLFAAPLSVLVVFATQWHGTWALIGVSFVGGLVLLAWLANVSPRELRSLKGSAQTGLVVAAGALAFVACAWRDGAGEPVEIAWIWNAPVGLAVALPLGYCLARPSQRGAR